MSANGAQQKNEESMEWGHFNLHPAGHISGLLYSRKKLFAGLPQRHGAPALSTNSALKNDPPRLSGTEAREQPPLDWPPETTCTSSSTASSRACGGEQPPRQSWTEFSADEYAGWDVFIAALRQKMERNHLNRSISLSSVLTELQQQSQTIIHCLTSACLQLLDASRLWEELAV